MRKYPCMGIFLLVSSFLIGSSGSTSPQNPSSYGVHLRMEDRHSIIIGNGLVEVTLSRPSGHVTGIKYNGINNVLQTMNRDSNRGYWDVVWHKPGHPITYDKLSGTHFNVIVEDEDQVEVSFSKLWHVTTGNSVVPLNVDKRYIVRRGCPGLYMYAILERQRGWPDVDIDQIRIVFKLNANRFHTMIISDDKQRIMPTLRDRRNGKPLAFPEAVVLTNPSNPLLRGEVDDKYQYSVENEKNRVHGWISDDGATGFWMITPSDEFRAGGPIKQDLTSHQGPTVLSMFTSTHYTGKGLKTQFRGGEPWKKIFGPVYVHLNSPSSIQNSTKLSLWQDAKNQMSIEVKHWPYDFPRSEDFPSSDKRGGVTGQLLVQDKYINRELMRASSAYVGLAARGGLGSWQTDAKGYQFWTRADKDGHFLIKDVRPGYYNLYAWVPGVIGDYKYHFDIKIEPGYEMKLGGLVYEPPRNGPTLWEIGIPDRRATEFFVPDAYPTLTNRLFLHHLTEKYRQYGLWDRYTDLYPTHDLIYTVGISNYTQDWFFAHVLRRTANKTYKGTTWRIIFELKKMNQLPVDYTLQIAIASANAAQLQVRINDKMTKRPHFSTRLIGKDNAIARHGIHGLYRLYSIRVPSSLLGRGSNTIYLTQPRAGGPFHGLMYDYIRLEGPSHSIISTTRCSQS